MNTKYCLICHFTVMYVTGSWYQRCYDFNYRAIFPFDLIHLSQLQVLTWCSGRLFQNRETWKPQKVDVNSYRGAVDTRVPVPVLEEFDEKACDFGIHERDRMTNRKQYLWSKKGVQDQRRTHSSLANIHINTLLLPPPYYPSSPSQCRPGTSNLFLSRRP